MRKQFRVRQSTLQPGKIDVVCHNNESHSLVWTLTTGEFAALVGEITRDMNGVLTEAWERQGGHQE
jgi:hypothetical protein